MIGLTDPEKTRAEASGHAEAGFLLALAEVSMYWETHSDRWRDCRHQDPPVPDEPVINIRIKDEGTRQDHIDAVAAIADFLGVPVAERHGCYIAQRRFTAGNHSVIVEAHYTPDPAEAHLLRLAAKEAAATKPDLAVAS